VTNKGILLFLLFSLNVSAQDTITIHHKVYSTTFSKSNHYPVKVEWWLTRAMLSCPTKIKRLGKFIPDPKLPSETNLQPDYDGSRFDRGHNFNAAGGVCDQTAMDESFYFSNITAQYSALNRGDWKLLESFIRKLALKNDSIKVWCGSIGKIKKIGKVSVPGQCWKVIYIKKTKQWFAYLFNNNTSKADGFIDNKVKKSDIEKLTGFKFE